MRYTIYLMILMIGLFLTACENRNPDRDAAKDRSAGELRNETREDLEEARDNLTVEKEEYEHKVEAYIDKMDTRIDQLKEKVKNESGSARVRTNRQINRMEKDRDAVQMRLDKIKSASAESWKDIRSDLDKMMTADRTADKDNE